MAARSVKDIDENRFIDIGFTSKRDAIEFMTSINLVRNAENRNRFMSILRSEKREKIDKPYIRKLVRDNLNEGRAGTKRGSVKLIMGDGYTYNVEERDGGNKAYQGKKYKLDLNKKQAAYAVSQSAQPRGEDIQIVKITLRDQQDNTLNQYRTRNAELLRFLMNEDLGWTDYYHEASDDLVIDTIKITNKERPDHNERAEGGFFPFKVKQGDKYNSLSDIEDTLKRYQVYYEDDRESNDNCFVHALVMDGQVTDSELQALKLRIRGSADIIPKTVIRDFATENSIRITVRSINNDGSTRTVSYPSSGYDQDHRQINIGLLHNHYFLIEKTEITSFSIKNYRKVRKEEKWWTITEIVNDIPRRDKRRKIDSFELIKLMIKHNLVEPISINQDSIYLTDRSNIDETKLVLDNSKEIEDYKPYEKYTLKRFAPKLTGDVWFHMVELTKEKPFSVKIAFDFESTTDGTIHEAYLVCYRFYINDEPYGPMMHQDTANCALDFLNDVNNTCNKIVTETVTKYGVPNFNDKHPSFNLAKTSFFKFTFFAHNITYDMHFIIKYLSDYNPITRAGSNICGGDFRYGNTKFHMKDTLAIITFGLGKFKDIFKFEDKLGKEVLPYNLYTSKTVNEYDQPISKALTLIKPEDHEQFIKNIDEWHTVDEFNNRSDVRIGEDLFDHILYSRIYCERDVDVMMAGYFKFRSWVRGVTYDPTTNRYTKDPNAMKIDIDDKLTISSVADEFFINEGCYKDCFKINGIARYFIQKTVIGGRCMAARNRMWDIDDTKLNDFDAVSLYPSAMKRLAEVGGYLQGKPKVITELTKKFLDKQSGYFIEVKINKIRKARAFPLISFINEEGVREFTNKLDKCNTFYFNKISFEDAIKYHELKPEDYTIIKGYYFDEGRNSTIGDSIEKIFNMRLEMKAQKNPVETLYKLIMNSSYGKTIMKEQSTKTVYKNSKKEFIKYICINYNHVVEAVKMSGCEKYLITVKKPISDHFNACHIGSEILAMSKRIMNEVMTLAEDNDIKIFYQDTDSMHIDNDKVQHLAELFKETYNRDLIGKSMGQFHCDFEPYSGKDALYAIRTIILGKKSYYDKVFYGEDIYHDHYRMKGIPPMIVAHRAKELAESKDSTIEPGESPIEYLYRLLYDDVEVTFDLLANNAISFKKSKDGTISSLMKFSRTVSFGGPSPK